MKNQLEQIAKSYDRHFIEYGNNDSLSYDNLPDYITSDPDYLAWKTEVESKETIGSGNNEEVKDYLLPEKNMKFIQLGCSVNLMDKEYDKWASLYHGVDISHLTIEVLKNYVVKENLSVGSLHCGSIHETPYEDNYFDIGECIGVLEYYERDFVEKSIMEFHRIIKPNGKFVLDIPNGKSPSGRIMMLIEECMGRPDRFNLTSREFEDIVNKYFVIEKSNRILAEEQGHMGIIYCLRCKK